LPALFFLSYCRFLNANRWNIYITPSVLKPSAQNRRKESFLQKQQIIYVDCDNRFCLDEIKSRYPTLVVRTSKGRYQVYWRLNQLVSVYDMENLMRAIASDIGADTAATDVSRVLRLPGFWNRKPQRNNTVNIVFSRDYAISYKSLLLRKGEKDGRCNYSQTRWLNSTISTLFLMKPSVFG